MDARVDTQATDSLGRVNFLVRRAQLRRPGQIEVRVRGTTLATVAAVLAPPRRHAEPAPPAVSAPAAPLLDAGFVRGTVQRGLPRTRLADALTFQVRMPSGGPLPGKGVTFHTG